MNKSDIEEIVNRVYPQIVKDLGRAKKGTPKVEVHNNVLAMHSGIPDHPGGENEHAEYDYKKNTIYLFKVALKSEQLVIQALLHEYTHATQDQKKYQAARAAGYENNKYEKQAHKAERNWRKYIMKEVNERLKKGESGCCHACGWSHVKGAKHKQPYKTGKNSCANRVNEVSYKVAGRQVTLIKGKKSDGTDWKVKFQNGKESPLSDVLSLIKPFPKGITEEITEDCGCGGRKRRDASYAIVEYLKTQEITEAEYQGRDVKLNKPMQGDTKKFKVYVKNAKGNVVKVNFGQKGMVIKKDNPEARKSFRARHKCDQKKDKTSPGYWSCKKW